MVMVIFRLYVFFCLEEFYIKFLGNVKIVMLNYWYFFVLNVRIWLKLLNVKV